MAIALLLGLAALIAWPVTSKYRLLAVQHLQAVKAASPKPPDAQLDAVAGAALASPGELEVFRSPMPGPWSAEDLESMRSQSIETGGVRWAGLVWKAQPLPADAVGPAWTYEWIDARQFLVRVPLWPFALALLLPAALWFTFTLIVPHFRGNLRLRSNLCLHCGYHLINIDSETCPECGAVRPLVTVSGDREA